MSIELDRNACDRSPNCMMVRLCPAGAITQKNGEYPEIDGRTCVECAQCVNACPHKALAIV